MVLPDIHEYKNKDSKTKIHFQKLIELRAFSFLVDLLVLVPIVSVLLQIIQTHLELNVLSKVVFGMMIFSLFQTVFLWMTGSTCGQMIFKLKVEVQSKDPNQTALELFLKYYSRQLMANFSFLALSFPFLSFITNKKNEIFYDRMTETKVVFKNSDLNSCFSEGFDIHPSLIKSSRRFQLLGYVLVMSLSLVLFKSYVAQEKSEAIVAVIKGDNHQRALASTEGFTPTQCYLGNVGAATGGDLRKLILLNTTDLLTDECLAFYSEIDSASDDKKWYWTAKALVETDVHIKNSYLQQLCGDESGIDSVLCQSNGRSIASENEKPKKTLKARLRDQILKEIDRK